MNEVYHFTVGEFKCTVLNDFQGTWSMTDLFPDVPEATLRAELTANGYADEFPRQGHNLLLDTGRQKILIDAGLPPAGPGTARGGALADRLKSVGVEPTAIDRIIITHGDGDHVGGLKNYPKAKLVLPRPAWHLWTDQTEYMVAEFVNLLKERMPPDQLAQQAAHRRDYAAYLTAQQARVELIDPQSEVVPGLRLIPAPGHRSDHTVLEVTSAGETLLHIVDSFRHPLQGLHPEWVSLFDSDPAQTTATAIVMMQRAVETRALVFGAHLPFPGLIRLRKKEGYYVWESLHV